MKLFGTTAMMKSLGNVELDNRRRLYAEYRRAGKKLFNPGAVFIGVSALTAGAALGLMILMVPAVMLLAVEAAVGIVWAKGTYENNLAQKEYDLRLPARKAAKAAKAASKADAAAAAQAPAPATSVLAEVPDLSGDFQRGIDKSVAVTTLKLKLHLLAGAVP